MEQETSNKEFWIVPKRSNLHQSICFIEAVLNKGYDNTAWNATKQNNIGNELRKRGATQFARTPSAQAMRTHLSLVQYLGFLYIDNSTTPRTLKVTEAGRRFFEHHKNDIKTVENLVSGRREKKLILTSPIFKSQFEKLQLTNPIELKYCENIFVFPFRIALKLISELGYLDREEIGYFLFNIKSEDEVPLTKLRIQKFRQQSKAERIKEIDVYSKTRFGNIALVQAPSANYFMGLCENTGIIKRVNNKRPNPGKEPLRKIPAIKIKDGKEETVQEILGEKYSEVKPYDFKDDTHLWMEYYGKPKRLSPPIDIQIINESRNQVFIVIEKENSMVGGDLVESNGTLVHPMFIQEDYDLIIINPVDGEHLSRHTITPDKTDTVFSFNADIPQDLKISDPNKLKEKILNHSAARNFEREFLSYLNVLRKITGQDYSDDKSLRGGYCEYLFFQLLNELKNRDIIDDVYWNGRLTKYGLPRPAPGGKLGDPDIVFKMNGEHFVLEVTVIKPKSTQFSAEGSSVPDHIKLFKENNPTKKVNGVYAAPLIHSRNTSAMQAVLKPTGITLKCITDCDLVKLLTSMNKDKIYKELKML